MLPLNAVYHIESKIMKGVNNVMNAVVSVMSSVAIFSYM